MPYYVVAITSIIEEAAQEAVRKFSHPAEELDVFDLRFTSRSDNLEDVAVDLIAFYAKCRKEELERDWEAQETPKDLEELCYRFSPQNLRGKIMRVYTDDHENVIRDAISIVEDLERAIHNLESQKGYVQRKAKSEFNELIDRVLKTPEYDDEPIELLRQMVLDHKPV